MGFGGLALGSLLQACSSSTGNYNVVFDPAHPLARSSLPMFPARAKNVIYLHMAGATISA